MAFGIGNVSVFVMTACSNPLNICVPFSLQTVLCRGVCM